MMLSNRSACHLTWPGPYQRCRSRAVHLPRSRLGVCAAASSEPTAPQVFDDLVRALNIDCKARVEQGANGLALYATQALKKGDPIITVPEALCIYTNTQTGAMGLPGGSWPRLQQGAANEEHVFTWDLLQALALMDAVAGDGGRLWEVYADQVLPQPEQLSLPLCWHPDLLQQLQHPAIIEAAQQQQERLRVMLPPGYLEPLAPDQPSCFQRAFACVRSRAFNYAPNVMGCVPFLDCANHVSNPNADVQLVDGASGQPLTREQAAAGQVPEAGSGGVQLFAVRDIAAGDEVTMSYSGAQGYTNQRFMAQYGFVPAGGNMADRLVLTVPERLSGATLRLSYLQDALGDALFHGIARGNSPYLFAALKSLPLSDAGDDSSTMAAGDSEQGSSSSSSKGLATTEEKALAAALLQQVDGEVAAYPTTLEVDQQLLQQLEEQLQGQQQQPAAATPGLAAAPTSSSSEGAGGSTSSSSSSSTPPGVDLRLLAAVRYRLERKRLLQAAQIALRVFQRD